jgi:hypothetical protein
MAASSASDQTIDYGFDENFDRFSFGEFLTRNEV